MEGNPFQFLEGVAIAPTPSKRMPPTSTCGVSSGRSRTSSTSVSPRWNQRVCSGDKLFGTDYSLRLYTHLGAGAYICGEETAMLESLEGKLGQPRLRPPFPPSFGLYGKPTVVNNVETLTNVPLIIAHGADWFHTIGTEKSPGTKIFSLSGRVKRPGNYELPLGTTFRELIFEHGGGIPDGRQDQSDHGRWAPPPR